MTRYLVTGSTGFIGSRLLGLLKTINCDVRLLARSKVDDYETVVCNLGQQSIPKQALESIDTIFHLAGFAHDMQDPSKVKHLYHAVNVEATVELARLAAVSGVKRFVFVSSVKAVGRHFLNIVQVRVTRVIQKEFMARTSERRNYNY